MISKHMFSATEAGKMLGVCTKTIHRWDAAGKIHAVRTPGNQRRIPATEILRLQGQSQSVQTRQRCVIYARVSSKKQDVDGNLERQKNRLLEVAQQKGYYVTRIIIEQASGINENRRGINKLFELISKDEVDIVMIEFKDRLARFGFRYLQQAFELKHVKLEVLETPPALEPNEELIQDMLSIVTVFAGRLYGNRARGCRKHLQSHLQIDEGQDISGCVHLETLTVL